MVTFNLFLYIHIVVCKWMVALLFWELGEHGHLCHTARVISVLMLGDSEPLSHSQEFVASSFSAWIQEL